MGKPIRVRVLGREYALRVDDDDEALTRQIAAYVDEKLRAFRTAHPEQPELTAAVITALAIAEELFTLRQGHAREAAALDDAIAHLEHHLAAALGDAEAAGARKDAPHGSALD